MEKPSICRICLTSTLKYVDLESQCNTKSNVTFRESFNFCTNLNAHAADNLPKILCIACAKELKSAFELIKKAEDSDLILKEKLKACTVHLDVSSEGISSFEKCQREVDRKHVNLKHVMSGKKVVGTTIPAEYQISCLETDEVILKDFGFDDINAKELHSTTQEITPGALPKYPLIIYDLEAPLYPVRLWVLTMYSIRTMYNTPRGPSARAYYYQGLLQYVYTVFDVSSMPGIKEFCNNNEFFLIQEALSWPGLLKKLPELDEPIPVKLKDLQGDDNTSEEVLEYEYEEISEHLDTSDPDDNQLDEIQTDNCEDQLVEETKMFQCSPCQKSFKTRRGWNFHMKTEHRNKKVHLCNICGRTCSQRTSLESHMLQHKGERPFVCEHCDKSYFTKGGLQSHMTAHVLENHPAKFLCSTCGRSFATSQRLRVHNLVHTGEKNFSCTMCPKKFATPFRLRNHVRIHTGERPFECKECGLKFAQSNALKCHQRIHTGEKPYECKICGKRFNQNTILKTHMTLHTGKTVQCPHCDKKFSRPSYLILHQRDHTGEKPYACHKCPNRYKQKSHLDRHLDTHMGVKHKCNICDKEYSKRSSLKIHMFEHADQKPFQCSDCNMSFSRRDKFKNHLRKVHNKFIVNDEVAQIVKEDMSDFSQNDQQIIIELPTYSTKRLGNAENMKDESVEYLEEDIDVVHTNN